MNHELSAKLDFINGLPFVVLDNLYTDEEVDLIFQESDYLISTNNLYEPEKVGVAMKQNKSLKKGKSVFLDSIYTDRNFSHILNVNRKTFHPDLMDELEKKHMFFRYLKTANRDSTLFSYFETSDYYKPHHDNAVLSCISWFHKKPKGFTGGDLILEGEKTIKCKHNRTLLFPSIFQHEVTPVKMKPWKEGKGLGRYCFVQFITMAPD